MLYSGLPIATSKVDGSDLSVGTLGGFIYVANSPYVGPGVYLLTNFHVLFKTVVIDKTRITFQGDFPDTTKKIGNPIYGKLDNNNDCAIAYYTEYIQLSGWGNYALNGGTQINFTDVDDPKEGDEVFKVGEKTGYTEGKIVCVDRSTIAKKSLANKLGIQNMANAFGITPADNAPNKMFADEGDSGSLIIKKSDNKVVGLLFKKENDTIGTGKTYGIAYNIKSQLQNFGDGARLAVIGDPYAIPFN